MASVNVRDETVEFDSPMLVEGLPGIGLVGKIATNHIIEQFDMTYFASVDCDGLPQVAIYRDRSRGVEPPVRLYADEERDVLALRSDVPISAAAVMGMPATARSIAKFTLLRAIASEGASPFSMRS